LNEAATEAALLRRLKFALQPADHLIRFQGIRTVTFKTLEHAPIFAARRQRQDQEGPAAGASRSFGVAHNGNLMTIN